MNDKALPCIVCGQELDNVGNENQPLQGTAFSTSGHYGSTAFDPMDGSMLEINVCDGCLDAKAKGGAVLRYSPRHYETYKPTAALWNGRP